MREAKIHNLVWLDLEMTGLSPEEDRILEIATLVTDKELNVIAKGPNLSVYQEEKILHGMNAWSQEHHHASGLIDRVRNSTVTEKEAEEETIKFIAAFVPPQTSPLCGNSVHQDRMFMRRYMPKLEQFFHYRNLDVSSFKIVAQLWSPHLIEDIPKRDLHIALSDIEDSIMEMKSYRQGLLNKEAQA